MSSFSIIGSGMLLLLLCLVCSTAAQDQQTEVELHKDLGKMEEIQGLLRTAMSLLDPSNNKSEADHPNYSACRCSGVQCTCCLATTYPAYGLCGQSCATARYVRYRNAFSVVLSIGGRRILCQEVPVSRPRCVCASVPYLRTREVLCVQMAGLKVSCGVATSCPTLLIKVNGRLVKSVRLGCFKVRICNDRKCNNPFELDSSDATGLNAIGMQEKEEEEEKDGLALCGDLGDEVVEMENIEPAN